LRGKLEHIPYPEAVERAFVEVLKPYGDAVVGAGAKGAASHN
jgi:hypothetical protein